MSNGTRKSERAQPALNVYQTRFTADLDALLHPAGAQRIFAGET
jgi:hypothetical protein